MPNKFDWTKKTAHEAMKISPEAEEFMRACETDESGVKLKAGNPTDEPKWRPISEAPKDGTKFLLASRKGRVADGYWSTKFGCWSWPFVMQEPLYFMKLPTPPHHRSSEQ